MKKQQKGFTVVELVIVIAVVAILAAVLIPTFSGIIKNANLSSDTQLARNMNTVIAGDGAQGVLLRAEDVVASLEANGFSNFNPKTAFYHFYWLKNENVIVLADENDFPVYPEGYEFTEYDEENWFDLKYTRDHPQPPTEATEPVDREPQVFTVTLRTSGDDDGLTIPFTQTTAIEGQPYQVTLNMPQEEDRIRRFRKITAIMQDGEEEYEFVIRKQFDSISDVSVTVDIPVVTGDITINVGIIEFVRITVIGDNVKENLNILCQKGMQFTTIDSSIQRALKEGYRATSAKITMGGKSIEDIYGDIFDKERHEIAGEFRSLIIRDDVVIEVESEWITYTVDFIIRDGKSEDIKVTKIVSYPSNDCLLDLSEVITNTDFKVLNKYYLASPSIRRESDKPELKYIESQKTVSIEKITTNLTVYIFVDSIK